MQHHYATKTRSRLKFRVAPGLAGLISLLALGAVSLPASAQTTGLLGEYYQIPASGIDNNNRAVVFSPAYLQYTHVDPNVAFDWGNNAPDADTGTGIQLAADHFAVRWLGQVVAPASEDVIFHTGADDKAYLWVSATPIDPSNPGTPTIDQWSTGCCIDVASKPITLVKGQKYYILEEMREDGGGANVHLSWESTSIGAATPIPTEDLIPGAPEFAFATITGTVSTPSGPAAGAIITTSGAKQTRVIADGSGKYTIPNAIPGDYTLSAFLPGSFAPVSGTVAGVTSGSTKTLNLALTSAVILAAYPLQYDRDWVNSADAPTDYTVLTTDPAFDASTLPKPGDAVKIGNVSFAFPNTATGANNVVALSLNTFLFAKAHYAALDILASNGGGVYVGQVTLTYDDGSTSVEPITINQNTAGPSTNEQDAVDATLLDNTGTAGATASIYYQFVPVDPGRVLVSAAFSGPLSGSSTTASPFLFGLDTESAEQPEKLATINGTVTAQGAAANGAVVRVGPLSQTTGANGNFSFAVPAGTYTVGALLPGKLAPVVSDITVAAGETKAVPLSLSAPVVQLQYPLNYSQDWISGADAPADYTYGDTAFIADQLPITNGTASFGSINFSMGGTAEGQQNMIFVNGQTLPVPEGNYDALYFLESCVSGSYTRDWTLNFTDGSTEKVNVQFTDWCGSASKFESEWKRTVMRNGPGGPTTPNCAIFYEPRFITNFTKKLKSITWNADPDGYGTNSGGVFALTLEAAAPPTIGNVSGTVTGPSGPVANAQVVLGYDPASQSQGGGWVIGKTGADGKFSGAAPTGTYLVSVVNRGSGLKPSTKSVTVTAGATTDAGTFTLASFGTQVVSWLGATDVNQGLRHINPITPDAASLPFVDAATTVAGQEGSKGTSFAFDVDDNFVYRGLPTSTVMVRVQYYDEGTDAIDLVYNSSDLTLGDGKNQKTVTGVITKGDTKTWKTEDIEIDDAGFFGTSPVGADLRIQSPGNLTLGYVVVSTGTPSDPGTKPATTIKGDITGDGKVNIADATSALQFAVGNGTPTAAQIAAGDVVGNDGKITIPDVTKILQAAIGAITL